MEPLYKWAISKRRVQTCENNNVQAKVHRQLESGEGLKTMNGVFVCVVGPDPVSYAC